MIRTLGPDDLDLAAELRARIGVDPNGGDPLGWGDVLGGQGAVLVSSDGARIDGFVQLRSVDHAPELTGADGVVSVDRWWVDPSRRRAGIGRELIDAAAEWATSQGASHLVGHVPAGDTDGQLALRGVGFGAIGDQTVYARPLPHRSTPEVGGDAEVELVPITEAMVRPICALTVGPHQRAFVAPNAWSLAEGSFSPHGWMRAITADGVVVGLATLHLDPAEAEPYLWRFMIDHRYQRLGIGRRALELVIDHVRDELGATRLSLSYLPMPGGPGPFYAARGFVDTGRVDHGEREAVLVL